MTPNQPRLLRPDSFHTHYDTDDGGFKVGVAIDGERHGSRLAFGVKWIRRGTERVDWRADDVTHEAYYMQQGTLRVTWADPQAGESTLRTGDCFYLPPGRDYSLQNVGDDDLVLVWAMTPPADDAGGS